MFAKMKLYATIKKNLLMNKLALILLKRALRFYRIQSKPLVSSLNAEVAWMSGIEDEERHLDKTQRIVERRLSTTAKRKRMSSTNSP